MNDSSAELPSANRRRRWVYLSLTVIAGAWVYRLLTLSRWRDLSDWSISRLFLTGVLGTALTWGFIFLLLKIEGEGPGHLGFTRHKLKTSLLPGVLFGAGSAVLSMFVLGPIAQAMFPGAEGPSLKHWFQGVPAIFVWLFLSLIGGGLNEEARRTFVLTRFEKGFGRIGLIVGLILQAVMFGLNHLYQGKGGAVSSGITGLIFGLIYLRRRSAWEAAIAHATNDLIVVSLLFLYYSRN